MVCSTLGLPVPHHLPELAQVHIHCIGDAMQPPHPLMPSFPSALNLSQHQGFFQWVMCSHQMTKILELQLQHQSFQWIFRVDLTYDWQVWSPCCPRDLQESSPSPPFQGFNSLSLCFFYGPAPTTIVTTGKTISLTTWTFVSRVMALLFNALSGLVNAFLPRSNCLLLSWLQSPSTVIWSPRRGNLSLLPHFPLLFAMQ